VPIGGQEMTESQRREAKYEIPLRAARDRIGKRRTEKRSAKKMELQKRTERLKSELLFVSTT
jgi:hypothetical protein